VLAQIEEDFPQQVRVVFRHYPLIGTPERPFHDKAALSMQAAEAAGAQGLFWEMHDLLFERQSEWISMTLPVYEDWLVARAAELDLDQARFAEELTSASNAAAAQQAYDDAIENGIPYTPFLLVDGQIWPQDVPLTYGNLSTVIKLTILEEMQYTSCPPMVIDDGKKYTATLHTSKGDIVIDLFPAEAPLAVNSFIFLARDGWYDGVSFYLVVPGFVAQTGDPTGTGFGGPGYAFDNEISPVLRYDAAGVVGMVNSGPGSNGSQFFMTFAPAPDLDGRYTIFGKVIDGIDVLQNLTPRNPSTSGDLPAGDLIVSVTITEE
jgi:cyclophilin family peptidyl-prolyl cis-trans isomerase